MSSLPLRTIVSPQQFATAEDALAWDTLNQHYLLQQVTGWVGEHLEGNPGGIIGPKNVASVINGCNVTYDPATGLVTINQGMVLFQNTAPDQGAGEAFNTKQLAICPTQQLGVPVQGSQYRYTIYYLVPEAQSNTGNRQFLDPNTGGIFTQNTVVSKGVIAKASIHAFAGNADPALVEVGEVTGLTDNRVPVALLFTTPSSVGPIAQDNFFDVRPLRSRGIARGEISYSAASYPADNTRARVSFINQSPGYSEPITSQNHDWLQTVVGLSTFFTPTLLNKHLSQGICDLRLSAAVYAANFGLGEFPAMNVVFEDGSFRRTTLRKEGGTLTGAGSQLTNLTNGLNWLYVYSCRSTSNSIPMYTISTNSPGATVPAYASSQLSGLRFLLPFKPYASALPGNIEAWMVGLLPIIKNGGSYSFPRFRAYDNRLYFLESDISDAALTSFNDDNLSASAFTVLSQTQALQFLPAFGTAKFRVSVDVNVNVTANDNPASFYRIRLLVGGRRIDAYAGIALLATGNHQRRLMLKFEVELCRGDVGVGGVTVGISSVAGSNFTTLQFLEVFSITWIKEAAWPPNGVPMLSALAPGLI